MIEITDRTVRSTEGKYIHRKGTETYFRAAIALPADTPADFEETDSIPAYTTAEYEAKVAELVRGQYTADEEFALQRKALNIALNPDTAKAIPDAELTALTAEFSAYNAYVEQCKTRAKELLQQSAGTPTE